MLEKPDIQEKKISACLQDNFGLSIAEISFLPLGADLGTAVYHTVDEDGNKYFVKLRRDPFAEISVSLPKFLYDQGITQIITPLVTERGQLWTELDPFKVILYPFIPGHDVYAANLSDGHWREFGSALRRIHSAEIPAELTNHIRRETFSPRWRDSIRLSLARIANDNFTNPVAMEVAALLHTRRDEVNDLVQRADRLAQLLTAKSPEFIVCHSDIHAGNLHIGTDNTLYIVDWDAPILAPKERDLMYIGGGLMGGWRSPEEEETLFYQGYGQTDINWQAIAYYRYERIIEDIAIYCEQLLFSADGGDDRAQSLHYLKSNFFPNSTIEIAYRSDRVTSIK